MKLGFSSLVCPNWDLRTIVNKASELGYDGVELRGLQGDLNLTRVATLCGNPSVTRQLFRGAGVELVCLGTSCSFDVTDRAELARQRGELDDYIRLASELECPFVRVFASSDRKSGTNRELLGQVADELAIVAPNAGEQKVTILVENSGDFSGSADLWYLCDCVAHPAIRVAWNPCTAMTLRERPTISIPRLGHRIGLFYACDGRFDSMGLMDAFVPPGTGDVELSRAIDLLKGVYYQDYLMFSWPKLWDASLAGPDEVLPEVHRFLRERADAKQAVLTAYKGDKNAPKFKSPPTRSVARPT